MKPLNIPGMKVEQRREQREEAGKGPKILVRLSDQRRKGPFLLRDVIKRHPLHTRIVVCSLTVGNWWQLADYSRFGNSCPTRFVAKC
jgi:hypothetical protein